MSTLALLLRPWEESDAEGLRDAIDEDLDHLKPWLGWTLEEPATLERTRERLRGYVTQWSEGRAFRFAVTPRDRPSRILGGVHLKVHPESLGSGPRTGEGTRDAHEIGYWVRKSATGMGVAGAAASSLVIHAFEERGADRVVSRCDTANDVSAEVALALGLRRVGEVEGAYPDGSSRPLLEFEMRRDGYRLRHAPVLRRRARRVRMVARRD